MPRATSFASLRLPLPAPDESDDEGRRSVPVCSFLFGGEYGGLRAVVVQHERGMWLWLGLAWFARNGSRTHARLVFGRDLLRRQMLIRNISVVAGQAQHTLVLFCW